MQTTPWFATSTALRSTRRADTSSPSSSTKPTRSEVAQVFSMFGGDRQFAYRYCLTLYLIRHFKGDAEFVDRNQAEAARSIGIAQHFGYARFLLPDATAQFGEDQIASLRVSEFKQRRIKARLLVG